MSRLDDLTAELVDKLSQGGANVEVEVRQRLLEAWQEGQLAMRVRMDAARKGKRDDEVLDVAVTEEFI